MKLGKKSSDRIDAAVNKAVNYEVAVSDLARRSERRAWWVAGGSLLMSLALAGVLAWMQPLKQKVPYIVMADPYSGTARLAMLSEGSDYRTMTASEAVNRSNVAQYVLARESYDSGLMKQRDYATLYTMSEPEVMRQYDNERDAKNPESPLKLYGDNHAIRTRILSITPLGAAAGSPPKGATVRFQRQLFDKNSGATQVLGNKIATMEFKYRPELRMDRDSDNMVNPLRFRVTSYRVDTDTATVVPAEIPVGTPVKPGESAGLPAQPDHPAADDAANPAVHPAAPAASPAVPAPAPAVPATQQPAGARP